ncbi:MAG: hypothetical protein AUJ52_01630 [Elusimicrobia bacterium CG1_02_63_36]|nr:MAG: hypothetical protein AUJ52_01630 [Elusimicrobia bacterium CG1_02_63_36]PIP84896.1 MAG: hypothetical protein COR54_01680 [Elusimicrobia bacterium CG22_combo_CG10-13_8_21_14_all_63_91]PJA13391.1 MAG: hypothetical protein COX66_15025 [Elusimicrobia bacterium CG_4_10_14_0_2_um_filter_63_34]PJB25626.1 MAG: hypothetical protein CO113_07720 [Elusimicrobia bacterium CG_4_9_14_3_um_filter_62_55]
MLSLRAFNCFYRNTAVISIDHPGSETPTMTHLERLVALVLTLSALWLSGGCATAGHVRGNSRAVAVYDERLSDCKDWFYDSFECRRMYGCTRHMDKAACGNQMLRVLNDPVKLADLF